MESEMDKRAWDDFAKQMAEDLTRKRERDFADIFSTFRPERRGNTTFFGDGSRTGNQFTAPDVSVVNSLDSTFQVVVARGGVTVKSPRIAELAKATRLAGHVQRSVARWAAEAGGYA
jgi:hypothetical protein